MQVLHVMDVMRMKNEDWQSVLKVNLGSAFRLCRAAVKPMMKTVLDGLSILPPLLVSLETQGRLTTVLQGGLDWYVQILGGRNCSPWYYGELCSAWIHHVSYDRCFA